MRTQPYRLVCSTALVVLLSAQVSVACGPAPWSQAQAQSLGGDVARAAGESLASLRRVRGAPSLSVSPGLGQRAASVHADALEVQGVWLNLETVRVVRVGYASAEVAEEQAERLVLHLSDADSAGEVLSFSAQAWPSDAPLASAEERAADDRSDAQAAEKLPAPAAVFVEVRGRELLLLSGPLSKDADRFAALRTAAWGVRGQTCGTQLVAAAVRPTKATAETPQLAILVQRPAGPLWTALEAASDTGTLVVRTESSGATASASAAVGKGTALEAIQALVGDLRPAPAEAPKGCPGCRTFCKNEGLHPDRADKRRKTAGEGSF